MKQVIEMDKILATVEQFQQMVENNNGIELECSFWVTKSDLYRLAAQEGLEVEHSRFSIDYNYWTDWYPIRVDGEANRCLTISFYCNE